MKAGPSLLYVTLAGLTAGACSDVARSASASVVDSAGVQVVTNGVGSIEAAETWSFPEAPAVAIGSGVDPEVPLVRVASVVPLEEGRVAVVMREHVQVFNADGSLAATLGRQGQGPGEFSAPASVVPIGGDSLAVWDQNRRRVSVFTGDGRFVRELDLSELVPLSPMAAPSLDVLTAYTYLLPSASGSLILFGVGMTGPGTGVRRIEVPTYRISTTGELLATMGPFPGEETFNFGAGQGGVFPYPFSANTVGAAAGEALAVGTAEATEFRVYDAAGRLERIVRWPDHDRTVAGPFLTDWTDFVDDWLAKRPAQQASAIREMMERIPRAERFPAYDGLISSDDGDIWVAEYAGEYTSLYPPRNLGPPARRWLVFDREGLLIATVQTPEGFQPHAVRNGLVWGVHTDELNVESVQAYRIQRP